MLRALEVLDHVVRQLDRGEVSAVEAMDTLLAEELSLREGRRIKAALQMARLSAVKTVRRRMLWDSEGGGLTGCGNSVPFRASM
jgi:hypothetical protein